VDAPADLPLPVLAAAALHEARHDTGDGPQQHLLELHRRPTEDVLERAMRWSASDDPDERALGVDVLRELGPADEDGRRPFSDRVVPHLVELLRVETDAVVERGLLQALAFNGAREAIGELLGRVDHPDSGIRTTVAFQLPSLIDPDRPGAEVLDALDHLTHDPVPDVRYYALYALVEESGFRVDPVRGLDAARRLVDDADLGVRALAAAHSGERIGTPLGPLALSLTCGGVPLGMPSAASVLASGARTARWDDLGGLTVDALVVPYTWESELLGHPRCTCWGIEWRLHARADTGPVQVTAQLSGYDEGVPGGGWHVATTEFEDDGHVLAIGGPQCDAVEDELDAGMHAASWRDQFDGSTQYGARSTSRGLTWLLPGLRAGESAATHVAVGWTAAGPEKAVDSAAWAVETTRAALRQLV
jgi:hypothetical protein